MEDWGKKERVTRCWTTPQELLKSHLEVLREFATSVLVPLRQIWVSVILNSSGENVCHQEHISKQRCHEQPLVEGFKQLIEELPDPRGLLFLGNRPAQLTHLAIHNRFHVRLLHAQLASAVLSFGTPKTQKQLRSSENSNVQELFARSHVIYACLREPKVQRIRIEATVLT